MRKLLLPICAVAIMLFVAATSFAQGTVSGKLLDAETGEPLISASVLVKGTNFGAISEIDGAFSIEGVPSGSQTLVITYVGYVEMEKEINVSGNTDAGNIELNPSTVGLSEVEVIASLARDRRTPVAVSTIKGDEVALLVGNQEYPEILRNTPSIYVTKQGGGFGDSRINVRGFDQRNTAVMINGIPVNDMENGWVYWSNWAGLADVTSTLQVQRGLGASKLAVPAVGGTINIVTNAADFKKGGVVDVNVGNDGYNKLGVVLSSGVMDNGLATTLQMTRTSGNGYVDGTSFEAYSYFLSSTYKINDKNTISGTILGAPQIHNQRIINNFDPITLETYVGEDHEWGTADDHPRGVRYNQFWGDLNGEEFSWRQNFYHKPKAFLNHYLDVNENTTLKTSAYISLGRGGGTGPRGRFRAPGSIFDSDSRTRNDEYGTDIEGQVRFNDMTAYHQGSTAYPEWGAKLPASSGAFAGQYVSTSNGRFMGSGDEGSGFVRRASMNYHDWYGVLSTLTSKLSETLTLTAGVDARYYKGEHFRRLENLLGNDAYLSTSDANNPERYITQADPVKFGNFYNSSYKDGTNVLNYHNDGLVSWLGLFGQIEYNTDQLSTFVSLSGSNQGFKRIDYFNYLETDAARETDWQNFLGGTVKAGVNYNLNENSNVFVNGGYLSRQPIFDNVFMNFVNDINPDVTNQSIYAFEAGYGYKSGNFRANLNIYNTLWTDRQFSTGFSNFEYVNTAGDTLVVDAQANFSNVGELHQGVELELQYRPSRKIDIRGMVSVGNWEYASDFQTQLIDTDNNAVIENTTLYLDGVKVGDAAQTTLSLRGTFELAQGLRVFGNYYYADNLFARFNVTDSQFFSPGGQVLQIPAYALVDAGLFYDFKVGDLDFSAKVVVNNVADNMYISELVTNRTDRTIYENKGYWGFGRTWNAGLKMRF